MKNKDNIKELLDYVQTAAELPLNVDEEAIIAHYHKEEDNQSLTIKILSVFGGILASLAFLGFLAIAGLYNSDIGLIVFGGIFIVGSIWIKKEYNKVIIDTVSVSFYLIGYILIGIGCVALKIEESALCIILMTIAFGSLCIVRNYILSFVSVLIINGSGLMLIILNKGYDLIHLYVSVLALATTYFFLKEAKIITNNKALYKLYNPVKTGLIFSFLSGIVLLGKKDIIPVSPNYIWLSSIAIISLIIYVIAQLFHVMNITETKHKLGVYIITVIALLPTALAPAIPGAILMILLSFFVNYKTGLVLGIVSFIYFISQYYYDLNFTLLTKSILLCSTGVFFIALYLFTHKKLNANEKI